MKKWKWLNDRCYNLIDYYCFARLRQVMEIDEHFDSLPVRWLEKEPFVFMLKMTLSMPSKFVLSEDVPGNSSMVESSHGLTWFLCNNLRSINFFLYCKYSNIRDTSARKILNTMISEKPPMFSIRTPSNFFATSPHSLSCFLNGHHTLFNSSK